MSPIEAVAAALGVINIVLLVRRSIWNYAFGIAMVVLYASIFFHQRLYSDALLQPFFLVVQIYGWLQWRRSAGADGAIVVEHLSWRARCWWAAIALAAWIAWSSAMDRFTDAAYPYWDGGIAVMSVTAQTLLARRLIENWPLWVAVDAVAIPLFWTKGLKPTAILYMLFLVLSLLGWREWRRAERASGTGVAA